MKCFIWRGWGFGVLVFFGYLMPVGGVPVEPPVKTGFYTNKVPCGHWGCGQIEQPPLKTGLYPNQISSGDSLTGQNQQLFDFPESEAMGQVTSVEQLSDVLPSDWAYQALKSLIERYGIRLGYPDGSFRGNQAMTRYEFAAALSEVLEKIQPLLGVDRESVEQDLATLQRLQREFSGALAQLRDRMDVLESRTTELENNRFSPTTKMTGQFIWTPTTGNQADFTFVSRVRLNLFTAWRPETGFLTTQLEMGNGGGDTVSALQNDDGVNLLGSTGLFAGAGGLDYVEVDPQVRLRKLYYSFPILSSATLTVGAKMSPRYFIDRNRFANNEAVDFNSSFFVNNPLIVQNQIDREGGAGVALNWAIKGTPITLNALYIAADAADPQNGGFFEDRNQGSVELQYAPNADMAVRLQYTNARINQTVINAFGINGEWAYSPTLGVFGRLGFGDYSGFNSVLGRELNASPWTWAVGVTFRNTPVPGTLAGIAIGQPFITGEVGNATQTNFEAFYNVLISDNISVTPTFLLVNNADNDSDNGTIWQFGLRTVFSF